MAVTKIHPIKSTLKKALDYIENPAKTDEKMLVSSFACSYETADIEFELLLSQAMQKGNNLAHHLIQSFAPGETTPEQAHEIGRQLADEVLQGKYPYVLTTHIDKGHVHNHIIFCAVDMVNQRKYVSNRQSYAYIRRTSDRLCKEHNLSVVMPGQDRGKSYAEWDAHRKGTSWKAKLKAAIDTTIPQAKDFDDFLRLLQEQSYEVKRGKYVSFRAPGQQRDKGHADQGNTAARDQLLDALALAAGVILSIALQQVDAAPDTQGTAQTDHDGLQSIDCAVEKFHEVLTFCRLFCGTQNCFFKKYRLIRWLHFRPTGQFRTGQTARPVRPPAAVSGAG